MAADEKAAFEEGPKPRTSIAEVRAYSGMGVLLVPTARAVGYSLSALRASLGDGGSGTPPVVQLRPPLVPARRSGRQRLAHGASRGIGNRVRMSQALEGRQIMAHSFSNLLTHVIFSTRGRQPFLTPDLRPDLLAYMGGIVRKLRGKTIESSAPLDHVHCLLSLPATLSVAEALRVLKANSSLWVHETRRLPAFAWQTGYGAFSVSQSNVPAVLKYIRGQDQHHRRISFQEELITLLKRHGLSYDERYLWE